VRPEYVLKQALKLLKAKWENKSADYIYIDDQFRSLRQDLTVQRI
jgi:SAC3 family protein LENG8/THP3